MSFLSGNQHSLVKYVGPKVSMFLLLRFLFKDGFQIKDI